MSGYRSSGTRINKRIGSQGGSIDPDGSIDRPYIIYAESFSDAKEQLDLLNLDDDKYAIVVRPREENRIWKKTSNIWNPLNVLTMQASLIENPSYASSLFVFPSETYLVTNP